MSGKLRAWLFIAEFVNLHQGASAALFSWLVPRAANSGF